LVSEKDIKKVLLQHPWMPREIAVRIVQDNESKPKTNTKAGKTEYQKEYMRRRRALQKLDVAQAVFGVPQGKRKRKR